MSSTFHLELELACSGSPGSRGPAPFSLLNVLSDLGSELYR